MTKRYGAILSIFVCLIAADTLSCDSKVRNVIDYGAVGKITLRIVDDRGEPVEGAGIEFNYFSNTKEKRIVVRSDNEGSYVFEDSVQIDMKYVVSKSGYYKTRNTYRFLAEARTHHETLATEGKWNPWNPEVRVILKRIRNPRPMYAKEIYQDYWIPTDQKVGFDFQVGDWVVPYGKGLITDFVLLVRSKVGEGQNRESEVSFNASGDGVRVMQMDSWSDFSSVYEAPDDSYLQHVGDRGQLSPKTGKGEDVYFYLIFRTRTKIDDSGKVVRGTFTKMRAPIQVEAVRGDKAMIRFRYWHNPDGTRNLEFDPKRNLFKVLDGLERVNVP